MHVKNYLFWSALAFSAQAHNWLTHPVPRGGLFGWIGDEGHCENQNGTIPEGQIYQRGQTFNASWVYNNHWNGFVRFSIVPAGQEQDPNAFHDPNNFVKITCHTKTCGGRQLGLDRPEFDYYAPYNLGQQSGFSHQDNADAENACHTPLTIPTWLEDGSYVLQWVMYGVHMGNAFGVVDEILPFFRSCANVAIIGGPDATPKPSDGCAFEWEGGDRALSSAENVNDINDMSDQCGYLLFNNIDSVGQYLPAGMTGLDGKAVHDASGYRAGLPKEVEACGGQVGANSTQQTTSKQSSRDSDKSKAKKGKHSDVEVDEKHRGWRRRRKVSF